MSEILLHESGGLMLLCIRGHCMAGYIRKVEKRRDGRVNNLSYLGLFLAQDLAPTLYQRYPVGTYIYRREKYVFGDRIQKLFGQHISRLARDR